MTFLDDLAISVISNVLEARTGQTITEDRRWRVGTVLGPLLRDYAITTRSELMAAITRRDSDAFVGAMVDALLNNETYFFRDIGVFRNLQERILPELAARSGWLRKLTIWSAGCSTGQEAVSLAILFAEQAELWRDWRIEIVATDVSAKAIGHARAGVYSQFEVQRGLGVMQMLRHFEEVPGGWRVRPDLSRMISYAEGSILDAAPRPGQFDLVLCRNVLLYFDDQRRIAALDRLASAMAPHGLLLLGGGETAAGRCSALVPHDDAFGVFARAALPLAGPAGKSRTASR